MPVWRYSNDGDCIYDIDSSSDSEPLFDQFWLGHPARAIDFGRLESFIGLLKFVCFFPVRWCCQSRIVMPDNEYLLNFGEEYTTVLGHILSTEFHLTCTCIS